MQSEGSETDNRKAAPLIALGSDGMRLLQVHNGGKP
jgi:hypothetical protein